MRSQAAARGHLDGAAGLGVRDRHLDAAIDPRHHRLQLLVEVREGGVAGRLGGAFREQDVHCPFARVGMMQRDGLVDRRHAVEHDAAHDAGVAAQEDLGGLGAVGPAEEIDLVVTEPGAHLVDVVHAEGGGVEPQIGDLGEAVAAPADGLRRKEIARQELRIGALGVRVRAVEIAIERVRTAGAALVHRQDVAALAQLLVIREAGCIPGGRPPRPAGQDDDRVRRPIGGERRQHHDVEVDLAAAPRRAVLPHRVGAA